VFVILAKKKLGLKVNAKITIVLEEDGTVVDEEDYFQQGVAQNDILMVLKSNEVWTGDSFELNTFTCVIYTFFLEL